jgi:hypothetical protein
MKEVNVRKIQIYQLSCDQNSLSNGKIFKMHNSKSLFLNELRTLITEKSSNGNNADEVLLHLYGKYGTRLCYEFGGLGDTKRIWV